MSDEPLRAEPGTLNLHVFDQDEVWLDVVGVPHPLHEMALTYRANVINHLLQRAEYFYQAKLEQRLTEELLAAHDGEHEQPPLPEDPIEWIESTPLMLRLRAMTPRWQDYVTNDRDELTDHDTGRWLITTESSSYLIDLDARTSTRNPQLAGDAALLRRDGETLPLIHLLRCQNGAPAIMLLDVRNDGFPTLRETTLVRRITRAIPSEEP